MNKAVYRILWAVVLMLALSLGGCRSSQGVPSSEVSPVGATFDAANSYELLTGSYKAWQDVEMPVKLSLEEPTGFSASGKAVMVNGRGMSISLRKLGFEVAVLYIGPEDIIMVSKPLRIAYRESTERVTAATGMTVADIQSALLGRLFIPGQGTADAAGRRRFDIVLAGYERADAIWTLKSKVKQHQTVFTARTSAADTTATISGIAVEAAGGIHVDFSGYEATPFGNVPETVSMQAAYGQRQFEASVKWTVDRAKWNTGATVSPPQIPAGYRILSTDALIRLLRDL